MRVGVIGGGSGLALDLKSAGIEVVGCAAGGRSPEQGIETIDGFVGFLEALDYPRRYLLDLPAGPIVDAVIDEAYQTMEPGDVVIDPTLSYWGDTLRRYRRMRHRSLFYQDVAWIASPRGRLLVCSGDAKGLPHSKDVLEAWAHAGGLGAAGAGRGEEGLRAVAGAGFAHYLAMIESAAEVARRSLASEVAQLIEAYPGEVEPQDKARFCPPHGIEEVGRASWVLDDAVRLEASVPLIAQALMQGLGEALEAHVSRPPPPRGAFVHPDDIL